MRRGHNADWLMGGNGEFMGINLGADYCAEHEWGIEKLQKILGVAEDLNIVGIERRRCKTPNKDYILLKEEGKILSLIVAPLHSLAGFEEKSLDAKEYSNCSWAFYSKGELVTCWDEGSLMIRVKGEKNIKKLRKLHEALLSGGVAMWLGGGHIFQNAGLCLAIISEVTQAQLEVMKEADEDRIRLDKASEKTGIKKKIDDSNDSWKKMREVETGIRCYYSPPHGYYALSPAWLGMGHKSKYKVMYFLNPMNQDKNEAGWFTVEQLEQWLQNKGPIPTKKTRDENYA